MGGRCHRRLSTYKKWKTGFHPVRRSRGKWVLALKHRTYLLFFFNTSFNLMFLVKNIQTKSMNFKGSNGQDVERIDFAHTKFNQQKNAYK